MMNKLGKWLSGAPSIVWIILLVAGLCGFIGSIIFSFFLLANVEGLASLIIIGVGWLAVVGSVSLPDKTSQPHSGAIDSFTKGALICFYALMGMAIDQPGNFVLNYPLRWLCPPATVISREVDVTHPLPGRTDITQDFRCVDASGKVIDRPSLFQVIGIRFVEYVIIAYLLVEIRKLQLRWRRSRATLT
ncbi:MAG TPA: hypothetical protein VD999_04035 [Vitreimonas sp.]|nr:hypothetical protein [Vitreimonas sp.]